jgi:lipopolysaccharide export system protein LptC
MSVARMPNPPPPRSGAGQRLAGTTTVPVRRPPSAAGIARRRWLVRWSKRLLPLFALALLSSLALWPELNRQADQARVTYRRSGAAEADAARMTDAHYRSVDERGRPYTITASTATQISPERVNLTDPVGDTTLQNGTWLMLSGKQGVFMQHLSQLDLQTDVVLYRDDGTTMKSTTATIDLKNGAAAGNDPVHAEGPFGVLDAQAFALTDKGDVIQFTGPAKLVINNTP